MVVVAIASATATQSTIPTLQIAMDCPITAKLGVVMTMSPTITLKGRHQVSVKKLIVSSRMVHSKLAELGELFMAPNTLGDISLLRLDGKTEWLVRKNVPVAVSEYYF